MLNTSFNPVVFFQRHLIPEESYYTCAVMTKATSCAGSSNRLLAHGASALLATIAVAMAAFNTLSYLAQTPFKAILNVLAIKPHHLLPTLLMDIKNVAASFIFVCLGITIFIWAALLLPDPIFIKFAPFVPQSEEQALIERLIKENERLEQRATSSEKENGELKYQIAINKETIKVLGQKSFSS